MAASRAAPDRPAALPEVERNRLLRRVDWRFLLPRAVPDVSVCFSAGLLAQAVALVSGRIVDPAVLAPGECDLAVAVNPTAATLRQAWRALEPGGSLYVEWYAPWATSARQARRRLTDCGFETTACYVPWPWPAVSPARYWVPVEHSHAVRYFLAHRPLPRSRFASLARLIGRRIWHALWQIGWQAPLCMVARKPGPPPSSDDCAARLLVTVGYRADNKVVALVFAEGQAQPTLAIKQARDSGGDPDLRREAGVLRALEGRADSIGGIPRIAFCREVGGLLAVAETALHGVPALTQVTPTSYQSLAEQATRWQIALAGAPLRPAAANWWRPLVESAFDEFILEFGRVLDPVLVDRCRLLLSRLTTLPSVPEQRDFSPWNVLIDASGAFAVLDWESAELDGLPATDLIYFLTHLAFFVDGAYQSTRFRASYRASLDRQTLTGRVRGHCLAQYASAVGVHVDALPALAVATWMLHARAEYQRIVADNGDRPGAQILRQALFLGLWEEELRQAI